MERIATEFNQLQFHAVQSKGLPLLDKIRPVSVVLDFHPLVFRNLLNGTGRPCFIALRFIVFHRYCTLFKQLKVYSALRQGDLSPCQYPFNSTCSLHGLLSLYLILAVSTVFQTSTSKTIVAY